MNTLIPFQFEMHALRVQVDDAAVEAVRGDAPAVQQHQRRRGAPAAQVGRRSGGRCRPRRG